MAGLPGAAALAGTPFRRAAPVVLDLAPLRRHGHLPGTEGRGLRRRRRRPSRLLASRHREAARAAAGSGPTDLSRSCRLPIPVLRVSGTPQRSETRPRAERRAPRRAAVLPWAERGHYPQRRATPEPPRSFRRGGPPSEAPRGGPSAGEAAALWAARARRPRTPRAGRGRGGRSAPAAPPRPGPEGSHWPPEPRAGSHLSPPSRPGPAPRRALTQGLRPAAYSAASASAPLNLPGGWRAACGVRRGRSLLQGQRSLSQRKRGVTPAQDGERLLDGSSRACPYASRSFLVGWERRGVGPLTSGGRGGSPLKTAPAPGYRIPAG